VMGSVRWRAHLQWPGRTGRTAVIGHGLCGGSPQDLGRREAILSANRRALYDVAVAIVVELDHSLSLKLKRRPRRDEAHCLQANGGRGVGPVDCCVIEGRGSSLVATRGPGCPSAYFSSASR